MAHLHTPKSYNKNIVLLSDAKSVLQALHNPRNREHSNLKASLLQLGLSAQQIVLQWLPGHCNIWGNTRADQLAKEGSQLEQLDGGSSYAESKTLVKAAMARKWKSDHPDSDPSDPTHEMTCSQQTIIFLLRTGHNRLRQHMYERFKVGDSEISPCGQAPQNTEHASDMLLTLTIKSQNVAKPHSSGEETLWHNGRTCPDSGLHCGIGSHCLTDSCRKNEEEEDKTHKE